MDAFPRGFVVPVQGRAARHRLPDLLEQDIRRQAAHLEHGKGMAGVAVRRVNGGQDLAARCVEVGLGGLAFGAVVKDGADVVGRQLRHGFFGTVDGLAAAEVRVDGRTNGPPKRDSKGEREVGEGAPHVHEPRLPNQRKQGHRTAQFAVGEVLERLSGVIEPREVGGAHRCR